MTTFPAPDLILIRRLMLTFLVVGLAIPSLSQAQSTLAGWDFSGLSGYGASPLTPTSSNSNVTVVGLTRGNGVATTGTSAANAWGGAAWAGQTDFSSASAAGATAAFSVTANVGYVTSLASVSAYNVRRSANGPTTGQWQYRIGGGDFINIGSPLTWGSTTSSGGNAQAAISLSGITALQNVPAGSVIEFRIVNYGGTTGTWYLNNFQT